MNAMRIWRRLSPRPKGHISLIFVSSDSKVREWRMSRFWYRTLIGVSGGAFIVLVILAMFSRSYVSSEQAQQPLETQLATANRKTAQLAQELSEMKKVAESIRHLAGVREFEATAPATVNEYTDVIEDSVTAEETVLAMGETRLPFLMRDRLTVAEDKDIGERQKTLFRSTPFIWPVRGWVTREFRSASDLLARQHAGMDIAAREGTPVIAAGDGTVTYADWDQDLGWLVVIQHGYGFTSRYGHNASLRVEKGHRIKRGQIIALVGNTGRSSAPHLHYEVWKNQTPVDPRAYLPEVIQWHDLQGVGQLSG